MTTEPSTVTACEDARRRMSVAAHALADDLLLYEQVTDVIYTREFADLPDEEQRAAHDRANEILRRRRILIAAYASAKEAARDD